LEHQVSFESELSVGSEHKKKGTDIIPDKRRLSLLINMASKREIVLPEFQRNFVWRRDDICAYYR